MSFKLKQAKKELSQILTKKEKEEYIKKIKDKKKKSVLETYYYFSEKHKINIIYENIDYLTLKINTLNLAALNIKDSLYGVLDHKRDIVSNKQKNITSFPNVPLYDVNVNNENFYFINLGEKYNGQLHVFGIYDQDKNKIGSLTLVNPKRKQTNNNINNTLELTGLFFKCYKHHLNYFLQYFGVSTTENDVVKRLDYCVDIKGIEVFQLLEYLKDIYKKTKNVQALTATDKKALLENFSSDLKYGTQETFKNFLGVLNDFKIYDKILDLLQVELIHRKVHGKNPYIDYVNSDSPIVRLELKKKASSFTKISNHSIDYLFENIQDLFYDYIKKFFFIDLSLYVGENIGLNGKTLFLAKEEKQKNLMRCFMMVKANLKTIEDYMGKEEVYKFLFKEYPELENFNPLDPFEISDFFLGYTDTL